MIKGEDLVLHQRGGGLFAGGFKIESLIGNSTGLKDLSVPAGLFLLQRPCVRDYAEFIKHEDSIDDLLYETLIKSAEYTEPKKVEKHKTSKKKKLNVIKKTRKTRR